MNIGLDIGTSFIKICCLQKEESSVSLVAHGFFKREHEDQLRDALQSPPLRSAKVCVSIEDPTIKIRSVTIPIVPKEEVAEVIRWSLRNVIGAAIQETILRYIPLSVAVPVESTDQTYIVFAIQKEALDRQLDGLKKLGVPHPVLMEPSVSALYFAVQKNIPFTETDRVVVVDLGNHVTHFAVTSLWGILFARTLGGMTGQALTRQIAKDLGVEEDVGEKYKCAYPETAISPEEKEKLELASRNFLNRASVEIQRSIDAYQTQFANQPITRIILTGGGSALNGLVSHLEETLRVPTVLLNPFEKVIMKDFDSSALQKKRYFYGVACGLAL
ncbi:MAG: pilus assembly protein PilM [Deltaproteobacteria bacterium]|nr:pilus assembly protein PilM [Deltaproteobacteria bacterium]